MSYRWVDHTAELELRLEAPTEAAVFEDALAAIAELVGGGRGRRPVVSYNVEVRAPDRAALLAGWLEELLFRAETEDLVPERVEEMRLDEFGLRARVSAWRGEPRHLVRGVTYHRLSLERVAE